MQQYTVSSEQRLDAFLASQSEMKSRMVAQKHIKAGHVFINDEPVTKPSYPLLEGDIVSIEIIDDSRTSQSSQLIAAIDMHLTVLYEDDACMVIAKPRGIAVHPAPTLGKEKTILHGAHFLLQERGLPFSAAETLVHRLDKETTGCLLLAKTPAGHLALQRQFQDRTVEKHYLALVAGTPDPAQAMIDAPVGRHATDRTKMAVLHTDKGREAKTTYHVIGNASGSSLVLCDLHTGRTHQIRVHMTSVHHPLLGDSAYATHSSKKLSAELEIDFLCLHAWKLSFMSPHTQAKTAVICPLPEDFASLLRRLAIALPE